jgi:hypothetical protein
MEVRCSFICKIVNARDAMTNGMRSERRTKMQAESPRRRLWHGPRSRSGRDPFRGRARGNGLRLRRRRPGLGAGLPFASPPGTGSQNPHPPAYCARRVGHLLLLLTLLRHVVYCAGASAGVCDSAETSGVTGLILTVDRICSRRLKTLSRSTCLTRPSSEALVVTFSANS